MGPDGIGDVLVGVLLAVAGIEKNHGVDVSVAVGVVVFEVDLAVKGRAGVGYHLARALVVVVIVVVAAVVFTVVGERHRTVEVELGLVYAVGVVDEILASARCALVEIGGEGLFRVGAFEFDVGILHENHRNAAHSRGGAVGKLVGQRSFCCSGACRSLGLARGDGVFKSLGVDGALTLDQTGHGDVGYVGAEEISFGGGTLAQVVGRNGRERAVGHAIAIFAVGIAGYGEGVGVGYERMEALVAHHANFDGGAVGLCYGLFAGECGSSIHLKCCKHCRSSCDKDRLLHF